MPKHATELCHLPGMSPLDELRLHVLCRSADGRVDVSDELLHLLPQEDDLAQHVDNDGRLVHLHRRCRRGERFHDFEEYLEEVPVDPGDDIRTGGLVLDGQGFHGSLVLKEAADARHLRLPPRGHAHLELVEVNLEPLCGFPQLLGALTVTHEKARRDRKEPWS